jgi:hypothetical protein
MSRTFLKENRVDKERPGQLFLSYVQCEKSILLDKKETCSQFLQLLSGEIQVIAG